MIENSNNKISMTKQAQKSKLKKKTVKNKSKITHTSFYQRFYVIRKPVIVAGSILLLALLVTNIVISQTVFPLYFSVLNENKDAVIMYLKKIMPLPFFQSELNKYKSIYGDIFEKEVFAEKYQRQQQIVTLETLLQKNPQTRDVLFALYQLYLTEGQTNRAKEYLKKAQQIDPMIKNR